VGWRAELTLVLAVYLLSELLTVAQQVGHVMKTDETGKKKLAMDDGSND